MYYKLNFHYSSTTPNYEWQFSNVPVIQELEYIIDSLIIGKVSQDRRKDKSMISERTNQSVLPEWERSV